MKLTLILILAVCLVATLAVGAFAGDYHTGTKLKCFQCHVMHATKSHLYTDDTHDSGAPWAMSSYDHLLKYADVNQLCFDCHNAGDKKDVYGLGDGLTMRSAGSFMGEVTTPYAPAASPLGHDLGVSATPPGGTVSTTLDCASCHDPHGNANFRNMRPNPADPTVTTGGVSYAIGTNDTTKDVFETVASTHDTNNVSYNLPDGTANHYEQFCVSCHTSVHSGDTTGGAWLKHPTMGYSVSYTAGTLSPLKTLGGTPVAGQTGTLVAGQVSCVTCHKAHGSDHPFGLIYDNRTTTVAEDGANVMQTCKHCHDKGLTATE